MSEFIQGPLPWNITESELLEIQAQARARRKEEERVREVLYGKRPEPEMCFEDFLLTFPKLDVEDSFFDRHPDRGDSNVSR
jgi:hypothetical protein